MKRFALRFDPDNSVIGGAAELYVITFDGDDMREYTYPYLGDDDWTLNAIGESMTADGHPPTLVAAAFALIVAAIT